ncbi:MAG: 1,4-alpha-glucan branching protein GlgB [Candidatus Marinimicrobia bacterium]|nr:1,4-alpha-glucan branching protein GlgB [Candidatus Neomarinimicrobiota bacterium]
MNKEQIEVLKQISYGESHNPHSVLGIHEDSSLKKTIRIYQQNAKQVYIQTIDSRKTKIELKKSEVTNVWEVSVKRKKFFTYKVFVEYENGEKHNYIDPYQFSPTINEEDLYLFGKGDNHFVYKNLGANPKTVDGIKGVSFAVWAPSARRISVVGNFNLWNGLLHQMRSLGGSGVWEIFIPELKSGELYKFEILTQNDGLKIKSDPYGKHFQLRPDNASIIYESKYKWKDKKFIDDKPKHFDNKPINIYEVHLGSWKRNENWEWYSYREIAPKLIKHVKKLGFTHIEFMPLSEFPFDGSWGYQVTGYYALTSRFGTPDDFKYLVDQCHKNGIGVIMDWVPAHFPKDDFALRRFDGTALYEHEDPKQGEHPDWGTLIFNYGRDEVKNFLLANAIYLLKEFHIDGLRIDAVASMIYLDYSREEGEWIPNKYGGNENLEAIGFMKHLTTVIGKYFPNSLMIAEESTAWGGVSNPVHSGGLGFDYKWNMGWMNDFLEYMKKDPIHRKYHHGELTFSMLYAYSEKFILVLSHDEIVHGKGSLLSKMPGDDWQKFANFKLMLAFMYSHPGKKLLFMGSEFAPWNEWNEMQGVQWELAQWSPHKDAELFLSKLNHLYLDESALWEKDNVPAGFEWIDSNNAEQSIVSFIRRGKNKKDDLIVVCNFTPETYFDFRLGVPTKGDYKEIFNSDDKEFNGSGVIKNGIHNTENENWNGKKQSIVFGLPPLAVVFFKKVIK